MDIVLVGAGAMALETEQYVLACNAAARGFYTDDGIVKSAASIKGLVFSGQGRIKDFLTRPPYLGTPEEHRPINAHYIIAIGDPASRRRLWLELTGKGAKFATLIHPSCVVATDARIDAGVVLCPFVFMGSLSHAGHNVVLNTYASVGHDARVAPHCVLSPYACLNGGAVLEEASFMGSHTLIAPRKKVGAGSKLAAGAIVLADVQPGSLVAGNPAAGRQMFVPPSAQGAS